MRMFQPFPLRDDNTSASHAMNFSPANANKENSRRHSCGPARIHGARRPPANILIDYRVNMLKPFAEAITAIGGESDRQECR